MKKARLFAVVLMIALTPATHAAQIHVQRPPQKTGTGPHDNYNLGALVNDGKPATYYLCVASVGKIDIRDARVTDGYGSELHVGDTVKKSMVIASMQAVMIDLNRDRMEIAASQGLTVVITSKKGVMRVSVPATEFKSALADADAEDKYRSEQIVLQLVLEGRAKRRAMFENLYASLLETSGSAAPAEYLKRGTALVSGQAFLKTRGGEIRVGAGNVIMLYPETEWYRSASTAMAGEKEGAPVPEELRAAIRRALRTTEADATGAFEFNGLSAGRYVLETTITWNTGVGETGGKVTRAFEIEEGQSSRVMLTR